MTDSVKLVRETFELLNAGEIDACVARMTRDFRINLAGADDVLVGRETWRSNLDYLMSAFSDLHVHVDDAFGAADRVVVMATLSGTHRGDFLGFPATGRRVTWASYEIYRIVDELIAEEWICSDLYGLTQRLAPA